MMRNNDRILVHLHVFYHEQVDYFIEKLKVLQGYDWDLIVTYVDENEESIRKLRAFKPEVVFRKTKNIGYDIYPFIEVIKNVDLSGYGYVIKLHTKRGKRKVRANVIPMRGMEMRDRLVDGVLYSPEYFRRVMGEFSKHPEIGMISNLVTYSKRNWDSYSPWIEKEMRRIGLECKGNHFCMGTMFIARSDVFKPLQDAPIEAGTFEDTLDDKERDFKSAHYYERILSVLPYSVGLTHKPLSPRKSDKARIMFARTMEKPFRWIFGIEKKGPEKRKFIRILGMEFYLEKGNKNGKK